MTRLTRAGAACAIVLSLAGCDMLFSGKNLFAGLDGPDMDKLKNASGSELVDQLNDSKGGETGGLGDTFAAKLKEDPALVDSIVDKLEDIYNDPSVPPADQAEAAALAAEVIMAATPAGEVIGNVVGAALALADEQPSGEMDPAKLIVEIIGADSPLLSDTQAFQDFAADLLAAKGAYEAVGGALLSDPGAIDLGLDAGQNAVIAIVFGTALDAVVVPGVPNPTDEQKAALFFEKLITPVQTGAEADLAGLYGGNEDTLKNQFDAVTTVSDPPADAYDALFKETGVTTLLDIMAGK